MSAHRLRLVLAPQARIDLRDVLRYTDQQWGSKRRDTYRQQLFEGFEELTKYPNLGKERPEYGPERRSFRIRQHVVVYQVVNNELRIARIIHVRRDIESLLEDQG
jgi:toxin ParE1/3/4